MHRLFLHFYLFLLLVLFGLGWTVDQLWQYAQGDQPPALIETLAEQMALVMRLPEAQWPSHLGLPYQLVASDSVSWQPAEWLLLQQGHLLPLFQDNSVFFYALRDDQLWQVGPLVLHERAGFDWFSILFFSLLAVAVALWLWPVARDIRFLQQGLARFGKGQPAALQLPARSFIAPIADSFQQMSQQIISLLELQREMTHAVSHELRTPIARLKFALEMATPLPEQDKQLMLQDVCELQQLVDEMLDYAKLQSHQLDLKKQQVDLTELIHNVSEKLAPLPGAPIHLQLPASALLYCDAHYLERALQNLLINAKRYAKSQITVELNLQQGCWRLSVNDDGPGIAVEHRAKVLKPFHRLEQSRNRDEGGFGLGLAIVQRIVQWHQGKLIISDSALGGASLQLLLPKD
ncbi:histidine kinase [Arsukibacterium sp. MJ3]|uniref:ATP-binding protein n=1 Tax=Arsukibacterium sp. MJ3 TaxID=1632859 RepID=UPI0006272FD2|nr:ATP-binding protein [Arsukibacterium sp. MJ3]KKO50173.1 histidine kinase [Arsukibacterium sp. MJ3]